MKYNFVKFRRNVKYKCVKERDEQKAKRAYDS